MEKYIRDIHALLVAKRAREIMQNPTNARSEADLDPKIEGHLTFKAAMEITLEELGHIESFISRRRSSSGENDTPPLL